MIFQVGKVIKIKYEIKLLTDTKQLEIKTSKFINKSTEHIIGCHRDYGQ